MDALRFRLDKDYPKFVMSSLLRGNVSPVCGLLRSGEPLSCGLRDLIAELLETKLRRPKGPSPKRLVWSPLIAQFTRKVINKEVNQELKLMRERDPGKKVTHHDAYEIVRARGGYSRLPKTWKKCQELLNKTTGAKKNK